MSEATTNEATSAPAGSAEAAPAAAASTAATTLLGDAPAAAQADAATQAADTQAGGEKAGEQTPDKGGEKSPEKTPEAKAEPVYDLKAPEGKSFDSATIASFTEVAKELSIAPEVAQKVLDKMAPVMAERQLEQYREAVSKLTDDARADKEFGGEKLSENLAIAERALAAFGTPELRTLLKTSGLGNHPELIRAFYRAGKAISEDTVHRGGSQPAAAANDAAKRLFPNQA